MVKMTLDLKGHISMVINMAALFISHDWMTFMAPTLDNVDLGLLIALVITPGFYICILHHIEHERGITVSDQDPACGSLYAKKKYYNYFWLKNQDKINHSILLCFF